MSFLNPVNEPVLRFKSTDAGAPQINYNSRVAGDVKAVLKACLVTGYGSKASAGWSVVNDVNHVAEFVSPSAAMSDYRLGIDDTSTSSTTWYYQYQDVRSNPSYNALTKSFSYADKAHVDNGWQLLVTARGILFVEIVQHSVVNKLSTRITHWGQLKSALTDVAGKNICFFSIGHNGGIAVPNYLYTRNTYPHTKIAGASDLKFTTPLPADRFVMSMSNIDLISAVYLTDSTGSFVAAQLPAILSNFVSNPLNVYGVDGVVIDGRPALSICAGYANGNPDWQITEARCFLIYLDNWEY